MKQIIFPLPYEDDSPYSYGVLEYKSEFRIRIERAVAAVEKSKLDFGGFYALESAALYLLSSELVPSDVRECIFSGAEVMVWDEVKIPGLSDIWADSDLSESVYDAEELSATVENYSRVLGYLDWRVQLRFRVEEKWLQSPSIQSCYL